MSWVFTQSLHLLSPFQRKFNPLSILRGKDEYQNPSLAAGEDVPYGNQGMIPYSGSREPLPLRIAPAANAFNKLVAMFGNLHSDFC